MNIISSRSRKAKHVILVKLHLSKRISVIFVYNETKFYVRVIDWGRNILLFIGNDIRIFKHIRNRESQLSYNVKYDFYFIQIKYHSCFEAESTQRQKV